MPKRIRSYPDKGTPGSDNMELSRTTDTINPTSIPEDSETTESPNPADSVKPESALTPSETIQSSNPEDMTKTADIQPPPSEFRLKRRKIVSFDDDSPDSTYFDPQKALHRRNKTDTSAASVSKSATNEWLHTNRQAGFIPDESDSGSSRQIPSHKIPTELLDKVRSLPQELSDRIGRKNRSGKKQFFSSSARRSFRGAYSDSSVGSKKRSASASHVRRSAENTSVQKRKTGAPDFSIFGWHISHSTVRLVLMGVFGAIALFSLIMIIRIVWRSIRTSQINQELAQRHSQLTDSDPDSVPIVFYKEVDPEEESGNIAGTENSTDDASQADTTVSQSEPSPTPEASYTLNDPSTPPPVVLTTKFHRIGGDALPEMGALYKDNHDLIGWLNIPEVLDLPVVYKNNVYYLTHDFYKKKNTSGTLFLDENHPYKEKTQNLLFHGHNMRDGSMFGRLTQYKSNFIFLKKNCFINYSSLWEKERYVIFAVLQVSLDTRSSDFFNYFTHPTFHSDIEFISYIADLMSHSMYAIPIDVKPSDALITLSTCLENDRLVIVARKIREDESTHRLKEIVSSATRQ